MNSLFTLSLIQNLRFIKKFSSTYYDMVLMRMSKMNFSTCAVGLPLPATSQITRSPLPNRPKVGSQRAAFRRFGGGLLVVFGVSDRGSLQIPFQLQNPFTAASFIIFERKLNPHLFILTHAYFLKRQQFDFLQVCI